MPLADLNHKPSIAHPEIRDKQVSLPGPSAIAQPSSQGGRTISTAFIDHLLRNKIITEDLARQAVEWKRQNEQDKRSFVEILGTEFGISQDELHLQVALFYAFRIIDSGERGLRRLLVSDAKKLMLGLPENIRQLATRYKVLPYDIAENQPDKIVLVTPNPSDREISHIARALPYKRYEICYMKERDWAEYWRQVMLEKEAPSAKSVKAPVADIPVVEDDAELESAIDRDINRSQLAAILENALVEAVRSGATDIHLVPQGSRKTDILFRIDGVLTLWFSVEDARPEAVIAAVKARSENADRYERFAFQEGWVQKLVDNRPIRFRVFIVPVVSRSLRSKMESVVIRIFRDEYGVPGLDRLGLDPYASRTLTDAISLSHGLVLVAGAAGRGTNDLLASALHSAIRPSLSAVTVEDPVEYVIEGTRQLKINHKLQFDDALKAVLEIDPDIVMIGEIRDRFTAEIALRVSSFGRLTFSSLVARSAVDALAVLLGMGIEPFAIAQGLAVVIARRFVRTLCPDCKQPVDKPDDRLLGLLGIQPEEAATMKFFKAGNCVGCQHGFRGRVPLYEALAITPEIRELLMWCKDRPDMHVIREEAARKGMKRFADGALDLLTKGLITAEDAVRASV